MSSMAAVGQRATPALALFRAAWLSVALLATAWLRGAVAATGPEAAIAAGGAFGVGVLLLGVAGGWTPSRPRLKNVAIGMVGGVVLMLVPWLLHGGVLAIGSRPDPLVLWVVLTALVATAEEILLRGVLLDALTSSLGSGPAIVATSLLFGLIHVPTYGWAVVPIDVAAGMWLAGLRRASGGVVAPIVAHLVADLATRWL